MRKRNLLVSLVLVFTLILTACGQDNPFIGSWRGTCDLTDFIVGSVVGDDETLRQYMEGVDGLEFVINFEFEENTMSMSVDEASGEAFIANLETSMKNMMEAVLVDGLSEYGISYEEYVAESGMDAEQLLDSMLDEMELMSQMDSMVDSMIEALELSGSYMFDEEKLTIVYDDGTYEEMMYEFDGDTLTITVVAEDGTEFPIVCGKQN